MLVTFVARPSQRHDVLELMSRILDFSEDEKEVVGLSNRGLLPPTPSRRYDAVEKKPLAQLWVDYLTQEAGGAPAAPAPAAATPASPAGATPASPARSHPAGTHFAASVPKYV